MEMTAANSKVGGDRKKTSRKDKKDNGARDDHVEEKGRFKSNLLVGGMNLADVICGAVACEQ